MNGTCFCLNLRNMSACCDRIIKRLFYFLLYKRIYKLLLVLLLTIRRSTKPPEVKTATHGPPLPSQSILSLPLYTLPRSSHVPLNLSLWHPPTPDEDDLAFRLAIDGWPKRTIILAICNPSSAERALAISTFLSL